MTQTKTSFLRRETALYSYFPANPPDAFLSLKTADGLRRFFFDVVPKDMPPSAINRRLINYMEFFDDGGWDATGSDLPKLLFLLETHPQKTACGALLMPCAVGLTWMMKLRYIQRRLRTWCVRIMLFGRILTSLVRFFP